MASEKRLIDANKLNVCYVNTGTVMFPKIEAFVRADDIADAPIVDAVVLPCKIGDTLYDIFEAVNNGGDEIKEYKVSTVQINITKNGRRFLCVENTLFPLDDFGKTTFLSREEAEAALAKTDGERKDNG